MEDEQKLQVLKQPYSQRNLEQMYRIPWL